ncbi:MAG: hypothetical protein ACQXXL_08440 [Candidatus Methanosuratincola sp.]|jgi:hypothetical protein
MISVYDARREKVYTFWDDESRRCCGEVRNVKTPHGWMWRCGLCGAEARKPWLGCEHMAHVLRFIQQRKREAEERARRLAELYPEETPQPRRKFAPVPE